MCGKGGMHGKWLCMAKGKVCLVEGGMQGKGSMHGKKWACVAKGGMHDRGNAWQGGLVWQERRPLQRTVRILLECILVDFMQWELIKP